MVVGVGPVRGHGPLAQSAETEDVTELGTVVVVEVVDDSRIYHSLLAVNGHCFLSEETYG